ncbi:MAG: hypothetical protein K2I34_08865, partial [Paramuribaculum sp.]|nr:hypothetical protein [Paramuribaculum sp.]
MLIASASASLAGPTSGSSAALPAVVVADSIIETIADSIADDASAPDSAATASILHRRRISPDVTADTTRPSGPRISRVKSDLDNPVAIHAPDAMGIVGRKHAV